MNSNDINLFEKQVNSWIKEQELVILENKEVIKHINFMTNNYKERKKILIKQNRYIKKLVTNYIKDIKSNKYGKLYKKIKIKFSREMNETK